MDTVTISRTQFEEFQKIKEEVKILRNTKLYSRLLECIRNLKEKQYTRKDLGI